MREGEGERKKERRKVGRKKVKGGGKSNREKAGRTSKESEKTSFQTLLKSMKQGEENKYVRRR